MANTENITDLFASTFPQLKRRKWQPDLLGPQPDATAINIGLASCGGRATLDALCNALRARPQGATHGECRGATVLAGGQPNEHRNQLSAKLAHGVVKLTAGEIKTPQKVYKSAGIEQRGGQTVIRIELTARTAKSAEAKAADHAEVKPAKKAKAKAAKSAKPKAAKANNVTLAPVPAERAHNEAGKAAEPDTGNAG